MKKLKVLNVVNSNTIIDKIHPRGSDRGERINKNRQLSRRINNYERSHG